MRLLPCLAVLALAPVLAPARQEQETPLQLGMEQMNGALRQIGRLVKDPAGLSAALGPIVEMQRGVLAAKGETPPLAETLQGEEREAFVRGFRTELARVLAKLAELEVACLEGRAEDAQALAQQLGDAKRAGHDAYKDRE
jgi:hypothetical protein